MTKIDFFSELIFTKKNSLPSEFCSHVIDKFEKDERKFQGLTGKGVDLDVKRSWDLLITNLDGWEEEDNVFYNSLLDAVGEYRDKVKSLNPNFKVPDYGMQSDSGYQIQRTKVNEFYKIHQDSATEAPGWRFLTYIWYLNDVYEGGKTQFINGKSVKPKEGKILLFPATWEYHHQGLPPISNTKYISTGWMYCADGIFMNLFNN
jgi:hypothetical protein